MQLKSNVVSKNNTANTASTSAKYNLLDETFNKSDDNTKAAPKPFCTSKQAD